MQESVATYKQRGKNRKIRVEQVWQMDNLIYAHQQARKRKGGQRGVRGVEKNRDELLLKLQQQLQAGEYVTSKGLEVVQHCPCGKDRLLHKLPYYPDHIVHHALMQTIMPAMDKYFYYDSCASVTNKGIHFAEKRTMKWIDKNKEAGRLYYCKLDFVKFYHNIDQEKCFAVLASKFGNKGIRQLLYQIVTTCEHGLGIGLYPIQPIANFYTSRMCREVMSRFKVFVEIYCDDVVILSRDKKEVWRAVNFIKDYAENVMQQPLHDNIGVQIIDEKHSLDFVGYRYYINRTFIRKRMKNKFKRKMARLSEPLHRYRVAVSYKGWLEHCNGFSLWKSIMGMKSFKDIQVPKFEKKDANGKRILEGRKVAIGMITDKKLEFCDAELGMTSKFGKPAAVVQVKSEDGKLFKFFTSSPRLLQILQYVSNKQEFPFSGRLVNRNDSGYPDYDIDD